MIDMYRKVRSLVYAESQELEKLGSLPPEVDASLLIAEHAEMKTVYQATFEWLESYFDFERGRTDARPLPQAEFMDKLTNYVSMAVRAEEKARSENKWNELGRLQAIRMGRKSAYIVVSDQLLRTKSINDNVKELLKQFPNFEIGFVEDLVNTHPEKARDLLALYEIRAHCEEDDYAKAIDIGIDAVKGYPGYVLGKPQETLLRSVKLLREDSKTHGPGILSEALTRAADSIESYVKPYQGLGRG